MSNSNVIVKNMEQIVEHLENLGMRLPTLFQPGLSAKELEAWQAKLPFLLTEELANLYRWRNGTKADEGDDLMDLWMFPGFYFLSIEEAVQSYADWSESPDWDANWFPVFADGAGGFYVVECGPKVVSGSPVIGFINGEPDNAVEYESLTKMMQTLVACFEEGAFFVDEDGALEMDDDQHQEIAHRLNPSVEEWQDLD